MERDPQTIPVRISNSEDAILLAAPMPGLEPQNISVSIRDHVVPSRPAVKGSVTLEAKFVRRAMAKSNERSLRLPDRLPETAQRQILRAILGFACD